MTVAPIHSASYTSPVQISVDNAEVIVYYLIFPVIWGCMAKLVGGLSYPIHGTALAMVSERLIMRRCAVHNQSLFLHGCYASGAWLSIHCFASFKDLAQCKNQLDWWQIRNLPSDLPLYCLISKVL
jgi:hypothetical protein